MSHDQFTLPFLDTTTLGGGFGLYGGFPTAKSGAHARINSKPETAEVLDAPVSIEPLVPAKDYHLAGERRLAETWKGRAEDNLAAIRLMTAIEAEGRPARADEQERLARFVSFGATDLADKLFRRAGEGFASAWEDLGLELEQLVSREDLASLKRATQYAHYTPELMVRAIWKALRRLGFDGGRVLEPGCGIGLFFALAPEALQGKLALTGVEMDATTARIAKLLYPNARIRREDFTKARLPEVFDLAIGNPPFSDRTVRADDRQARDHIASMADLIGAVRMPQGAMHAAAGTEVVVDILFLQKRMRARRPAARCGRRFPRPFGRKAPTRRCRSTATSSTTPRWSLGAMRARRAPMGLSTPANLCSRPSARSKTSLPTPSIACHPISSGRAALSR
jgi:predicted RNA methylase